MSPHSAPLVEETELNWISETTEVEGTLRVEHTARIRGKVRGRIEGKPGSLIIIMAQAVIEGEIFGDRVIIDGFVQGDVRVQTQLKLTSHSKLIGSVQAPSLVIESGAHLEGRARMDGDTRN